MFCLIIMKKITFFLVLLFVLSYVSPVTMSGQIIDGYSTLLDYIDVVNVCPCPGTKKTYFGEKYKTFFPNGKVYTRDYDTEILLVEGIDVAWIDSFENIVCNVTDNNLNQNRHGQNALLSFDEGRLYLPVCIDENRTKITAYVGDKFIDSDYCI